MSATVCSICGVLVDLNAGHAIYCGNTVHTHCGMVARDVAALAAGSEIDARPGRKDDQAKDPWHLAPWDAFRAIVRVLRVGAEKYEERNWEKGMAWSRLFSALQRHLAAWWEGEALDAETGMSHLWHAGCCVAFLISYEIRGVGKDDRPRKAAA